MIRTNLIGILLIEFFTGCTFSFKSDEGSNESGTKETVIQKLEIETKKYTDKPNLQNAIKQKAQVFIQIAEGDTNYDELYNKIEIARSCVFSIMDDYPGSRNSSDFLEDFIFDNSTKRKRYTKFNSYLSGRLLFGRDNTKKDCDFELQ